MRGPIKSSTTILLGWVSRLAFIILSFISTPILIELIGADGYAYYLFLLSLGPWFALFNFGLPQTLQNTLSRLRALNLRSTKLVAYYNGATLLVAILLAPLVLCIASLIHHFLPSHNHVVSSKAVIIFSLSLFTIGLFQLFASTLYGMHRNTWPNVYPAINSFLVCVACLLMRIIEIRNVNVVIIVISLLSLVTPVHSLLQSSAYSNLRINPRVSFALVKRSKNYFRFSLVAAATLSIDYIVMSKILAAAEIVQYALVTKIFMLIFSFYQIMLLNKWSTLSDMLHFRRFEAARKLVLSLITKGFVFSCVVGFFLLLISPLLVAKLSWGVSVVRSPVLPLIALMYVFVRIWSDTYSMSLLCFDKARKINAIVLLQSVISAAFQVIFGNLFGSIGILMGIILSFLLTVTWYLPTKFYQYTR